MTRFAKSALPALLALCTPLGTSLGVTQAVHAADLAVSSDEDSGVCGRPWVLNRITSRFSYQVHHVPHLPNVQIVDFQGIHQQEYLPANETWPIGRLYCGATVSLSDGDARPIWYLIEYGQGFAGVGNNVEFCVAGFDRWYVYDGRCRVLR